jgi:mannose-6-phosphate isomerase
MPDVQNLSPLIFEPIYKEKIWGGQGLRLKLDKNIPQNRPVGESWELSGLSGNESVVMRGPLSGKKLSEVFNAGQNINGKNAAFPLLYKFIDANRDLSIQVHPGYNNTLKSPVSGDSKTECWYIIDAKPGTRVICGFKKGVKLQDVNDACETGNLPDLCNYIPISSGDVVFVPAGVIHGTFANTLIYEVQQSSDAIFRMFDWNRVDDNGQPRPLHAKEAMNALDMTYHEYHVIEPVKMDDIGAYHAIRVACRYFAVEEYRCAGPTSLELPARKTFQVITVLNGSICFSGESQAASFVKGETVFVPVSTHAYEINTEANTQFLLSYTPELVSDIISPLLRSGASKDAIVQLGGNPSSSDLRIPLESFRS